MLGQFFKYRSRDIRRQRESSRDVLFEHSLTAKQIVARIRRKCTTLVNIWRIETLASRARV